MALNCYWCNSLTGGGTGALDAIDGTDLADGDAAQVIDNTNGKFYVYYLDGDSAASESSPDIIKPDQNAGNKRWILIPVVLSKPGSGGYVIRSFRREANGDLTYVYKETAES